jgi:hypothetical protein
MARRRNVTGATAPRQVARQIAAAHRALGKMKKQDSRVAQTCSLGLRLFVGGAYVHACNPLTRPAAADESAVAGHPLPQGGEGWFFD